ncbi:MAG: hypothetical protein KDD82_25540, partial [Planctomycetes bacterium]|nr:hypothetical protein [Planctomycetota bacterium]
MATAAAAAPGSAAVAPVDSAAGLVRAGVEAYAFPTASQATVERELAFLVRTPTAEAGALLVDEARHARALLRDLDRSQERLEKQRLRLTQQAARVRRSRTPLEGAALEEKQRQFELTATKLTIQAEQRARLGALTDALLQALERKTDAPAAAVFADALR